jgi:hypothetical protein
MAARRRWAGRGAAGRGGGSTGGTTRTKGDGCGRPRWARWAWGLAKELEACWRARPGWRDGLGPPARTRTARSGRRETLPPDRDRAGLASNSPLSRYPRQLPLAFVAWFSPPGSGAENRARPSPGRPSLSRLFGWPGPGAGPSTGAARRPVVHGRDANEAGGAAHPRKATAGGPRLGCTAWCGIVWPGPARPGTPVTPPTRPGPGPGQAGHSASAGGPGGPVVRVAHRWRRRYGPGPARRATVTQAGTHLSSSSESGARAGPGQGPLS